MGIGKHGMSLAESRAAADSVEFSPSKTAASSHIATSGTHKSGSHKTKHSHGPATSGGKKTAPFGGSGGGGGGHNRKGKKY